MTQRLLIVSGDGHMGARPEMYRDYLDVEFRDALDDLVAENAEFLRLTQTRPTIAETKKYGDAVPIDDDFPGWNVARRLADLDREGVAAEIVHGGHQGSVLPFYSVMNKPYPAELRAAGARAFHRWIGDRLAESHGRMFGVADPGPCLDMPATIRELEWVAQHGFVSVSLPQNTWNPDLPPIHDPYYEPVWHTCAELGLVLSVHAGWGSVQGKFWEFAAQFGKHVVGGTASDEEVSSIMMEAMASSEDSPLVLDMGPRRALWQLMLGGVFDRHPDLKLCLTEVRADWAPSTIALLDDRCGRLVPVMKLKPSEYWQQNCFVTPSSIHKCEVEMRHEIGVEHLMFGTDYPHPESTWPHTRDWIRFAFENVAEDEVRAILADNAIRCYNLDRASLELTAARIGLNPEDVLTSHDVDPELLDHFDKRAGLRRPAEQADPTTVERLLAEDLVAVGAGTA